MMNCEIGYFQKGGRIFPPDKTPENPNPIPVPVQLNTVLSDTDQKNTPPRSKLETHIRATRKFIESKSLE